MINNKTKLLTTKRRRKFKNDKLLLQNNDKDT